MIEGDGVPVDTAPGGLDALDGPLELVLITGMSGGGKSVALRALEDSGYVCVDNLPTELLDAFVSLQRRQGGGRVAVAIDVRSAASLPYLPEQLTLIREAGVPLQVVFLDATTDTLVRRYSETRRRHPLSATAETQAGDERRALVEAIELERELLADLREQAHVIDTSLLRASQFQTVLKGIINSPGGRPTLAFESFAFKRGIPVDADFVFDVRMLPNPHYEPGLKDLTGRDAPVIEFLAQQPAVARMQADIVTFLQRWLQPLAADHRSYVTVAVGCTGGQHRSVYLVEQLSRQFGGEWVTVRRHRELDR